MTYSVVVYILPTLAAILCYINGLDGEFVHDDIYAIKNNPDAIGKTLISQLFRNDFWGKPMCDNTSHKSYRPLTVLTFRLDYNLGGGRPSEFHAVNLTLHTAVVLLFLHVLRHVLLVPDVVACTATLLFAVHPIHTEAVFHTMTRKQSFLLISPLLLIIVDETDQIIRITINQHNKELAAVPTQEDEIFSIEVTGIVGRAELLSCLGVLLTLLFYSKGVGTRKIYEPKKSTCDQWTGRSQWLYFWLAMVTSGAAMLCKEQGITALGICAVLDVCLFSRPVTRRFLLTRTVVPDLSALLKNSTALRLFALLCVGILLLLFRLWMLCGEMPSFRDEDNPASFSASFLTRVLTFNYLVAFNLWLLLCPAVLSYDWQGDSIPLITGLCDVRNLATVTVYIVIVLASFRCLHDLFKEDENKVVDNNNKPGQQLAAYSNHSQHPLLFAMVLMVLPFIPSSNLLFNVGFVVAERVLYIPSLGFCLLVSQGAVESWQRYRHNKYLGRCLIVLATVLLAILVAKTYTRNYVWKNRESLFWSGVQTLPGNAKMHYNYANFLKDNGSDEQAAQHYRTAISLYPRQSSYHNNLGTVLRDSTQAEACYREALNLHPNHRGALVNLGNLLINRNDSSGEQLLLKALRLYPDSMDALLSLIQLEMRRGQPKKAEHYIKEALRQRPDRADLYNYRGILFHEQGQYEEAVVNYQQAVHLDSTFIPAMTNAAVSLMQLDRFVEAETVLKRAVTVSPHHLEAIDLLAQLYQLMGRTQDAVDIYSNLADNIAPNDTVHLLRFVKTLIDKRDFRRAEEMLARMLTRTPHSADLLFARAHVQLGLGNVQEAVLTFQEASRWAVDNRHLMAKIHYELGNIYKDLKHYSQALQYYQSSVSEVPVLTNAHLNLGALYHIMGHYDQAMEQYEHVLRVEPDNQILLQNLAKLKRVLSTHKQHGTN